MTLEEGLKYIRTIPINVTIDNFVFGSKSQVSIVQLIKCIFISVNVAYCSQNGLSFYDVPLKGRNYTNKI